MRLDEIDWTVLRGAAIALFVATIISVLALAASYRFWGEQDRALRSERTSLLNARGQYQTLDEEEDIIATYLPRYVALEERGVIGREQRLDWIDALREAARTMGVGRLEYTLQAQQRFETGMDLQVGAYRVYASTMRVNLGLLHEGDLFNVLSRLQRDVPGLLGVNDCQLGRREPQVAMSASAVNVEALCHLNFITIRTPQQADTPS